MTLTRREYGKNSSFLKIIVDRVVAPAVLYGSEIWGHKATQAFNIRHLNAAQRPFLRVIVRAYKITPTAAAAALQVLCSAPAW